MKRFIYTLIIFWSIVATGCSDSSTNVWDELPTKISEFVARYFPGQPVSRYADDDGTYYVTVKNGPQIAFDAAMEWTSIDGEGEIIPQIFLFDELPPAMYSYLQQIDSTNRVVKVSHTDTAFTVEISNGGTITYDLATGSVTQP